MFTALTPTGRAVPSYLHDTSPETRTFVDNKGQRTMPRNLNYLIYTYEFLHNCQIWANRSDLCVRPTRALQMEEDKV